MASIAASSIGTISSTFLVGGHGSSSHNLFFLLKSSTIRSLAFRRRLQAQPTPLETIDVDKVVNGDTGLNKNRKILACPICYLPLSVISDGILNVGWESMANLQCSCCRKTYYRKESHVELIAASGAKTYNEPMPIATEFFRLPLISFLYERGWRQNFAFGGFPGVEKEFELIKKYVRPVLGGNIVDASCGSGLFSRLFAKSGLFSLVIALDYSENMLQQCYDFVKQDRDFPQEKLILVRADISRLPFVAGSIDVVHAGAAIHCWPSPSSANVSEFTGAYSFLSEGELEDICQACGLEGFTCVRNRQFVMFSATKPL
ncbi:Uncharacterized methyltransferase At1g78140, chloroplastic [Linum perenne]